MTMYGISKQEMKARILGLLEQHKAGDIPTAIEILLEACIIHYQKAINATAHIELKHEYDEKA